MAQSTNDTIPTAIRLGCLMRLEELTGTVRALAKAFESKAESKCEFESNNLKR